VMSTDGLKPRASDSTTDRGRVTGAASRSHFESWGRRLMPTLGTIVEDPRRGPRGSPGVAAQPLASPRVRAIVTRCEPTALASLLEEAKSAQPCRLVRS